MKTPLGWEGTRGYAIAGVLKDRARAMRSRRLSPRSLSVKDFNRPIATKATASDEPSPSIVYRLTVGLTRRRGKRHVGDQHAALRLLVKRKLHRANVVQVHTAERTQRHAYRIQHDLRHWSSFTRRKIQRT